MALAELMGVTFSCTPVGFGDFAVGHEPHVHYRAPRADAPIIHLYNRPLDHFFVVDGQYGSTVGDGNCLYNGFAQLIRQFILEEEDGHRNVYVNQADIYNKIKNLPAEPIEELVARVLRQHLKKEDRPALEAALLIAKNDEKLIASFYGPRASACSAIPPVENQEISEDALSSRRQQLLRLIDLIRKQGQALGTTDHQEKANQLANTLEHKINLFFDLPHQEKQDRFSSFKKECLGELTDAKSWSNHCDCQQIFFDILQTLTVIGALVGAVKWLVTGRYSLFSTPTTDLLETMEQTTQSLMH